MRLLVCSHVIFAYFLNWCLCQRVSGAMKGKEQYIREMWEYYYRERSRVKKFREEAEKIGKQEYRVSGSWNDTDCTHRMMKHGFFALKSGKWEEYKNAFRKEVKVTEWTFDRIKEAFEKVAKDEARKLSVVKEIMITSTDYLRRNIAPAGEARRRYDVILVPAK